MDFNEAEEPRRRTLPSTLILQGFPQHLVQLQDITAGNTVGAQHFIDLHAQLSHETSQFACDSLLWYWNRIGKQCYPDATSILLLLDCGGSNAANRFIFKYYLQILADSIGIEIRVAHYPSYCSKYNRIERRLFPHITRACSGMLFDTLDTVVNLMRKATTTTGLATTVNVIRRCYETGQVATKEIKQNLKIRFDQLLPKWNYSAVPQLGTVIF